MRRCAICGKSRRIGYWICKRCSHRWDIHGKPYRNWPKWVKALVILQQKQERSAKRTKIHSMSPGFLKSRIEENQDMATSLDEVILPDLVEILQ